MISNGWCARPSLSLNLDLPGNISPSPCQGEGWDVDILVEFAVAEPTFKVAAPFILNGI